LKFKDFEAAFGHCREIDAPCVIEIAGEISRIYPSGRAVTLRPALRESKPDGRDFRACPADHLRD